MIYQALAALLVAPAVCMAAPTSPFLSMGKSGEEGDLVLCANLGPNRLRIDSSGRFRLNGVKASRLPLRKTESIEWLWTKQIDEAVLVAYEVSDRTEDSSSGGVCRFSANFDKRQWCTAFPAFNVVASLSSSGTIFLAGIGSAGEYNARSGALLWKVRGLYERSRAFNSFLSPVERDGGFVEFFASAGTRGSEHWSAVVDRKSGTLVSARPAQTVSNEAKEVERKAGECAR